MKKADSLPLLLEKRRWVLDLLYSYPFSVIIYQAVWSWIFIWITPWIGWLLFFKNVLFATDSFIRMTLGIPMNHHNNKRGNNNNDDERRIRPSQFIRNNKQQELAVLITNCENGTGRQMAFDLSKKGFVVFAGCQTDNGKRQYAGRKRIIPLKLDVTSESDVNAAFQTISRWITSHNSGGNSSSGGSNTSSSSRSVSSTSNNSNAPITSRYFHALVNNHTTCNDSSSSSLLGMADMLTMDDYHHSMDKSFFGSIRTIKTCLPLLKQQAMDQTYDKGRIIQLSTSTVSSLGLIDSSTSSSKGQSSQKATNLALEGFIQSIKEELKDDFNIDVLHIQQKDEQHSHMIMSQQIQNVWNTLPSSIKNQYGEEYFQTFRNNMIHNTRNPSVLLGGELSSDYENIMDAIELENPSNGMMGHHVMNPITVLLTSKHSPLWGILPGSVSSIITSLIFKICYGGGGGGGALLAPTKVKPAAMTKLSAGY